MVKVNSNEVISQIKLISECFDRPITQVEATNQPYYLGRSDLVFLSLDQMQKGLLFPTKPKNIQSQLLDKLKDALSISLVHFYPLAGQLVTEKFEAEHAIWVYVDCNKGPEARVIHALVGNVTFSDLMKSIDVHPVIRSFFDLGEKAVNYDGHTRLLLSIQVTELLDAIFIGFTMNHSVADGTSLWHFISTLSEIFLQLDDNDKGSNENAILSISRKPVFKPFFPDGYGPVVKLPFLEPNEFITRHVDIVPLRERTFHFSPTSISYLKAKANKECGLTHQNISSFQALSAFLWISITRARNLESDQDTDIVLICNVRPKIIPPLSDDYFGGFVQSVQGTCNGQELLSKDLGWASALIHELVMGLDNKAGIASFKKFVEAPFVAQPSSNDVLNKPNGVLIGGLVRFDVYGPQFGLGKSIALLTGYANKKDGKVTANPGREGGGSRDGRRVKFGGFRTASAPVGAGMGIGLVGGGWVWI